MVDFDWPAILRKKVLYGSLEEYAPRDRLASHHQVDPLRRDSSHLDSDGDLVIGDPDIRQLARPLIRREFPGCLLLDEIPLANGKVIADLFAFAGEQLHGFEIKSQKDRLNRLPLQIQLYGELFDRVTIFTTTNHLDLVRQAVPSWWGVYVAEWKQGLGLRNVQMGSLNPRATELSPMAVNALLRKSEIEELVKSLLPASGGVGCTRPELEDFLGRYRTRVQLISHAREFYTSRALDPEWGPIHLKAA